jgi:hypothetical protein
VTLGLAGAVAVRLGKLPIALLMVPPHPAANNPATSRVVGRESLFAERLMLILPRRVWPTAGASVRPRRSSFVARARMTLAARPCDPQAARLGGYCLRHHRDCAAPPLGLDPGERPVGISQRGSQRRSQTAIRNPSSYPRLRSADKGASYGSVTGNPRRAGTVTARGRDQQVAAAFAALPGSRALTWDGAQRMALASGGFRRLTVGGPQPKCDLGYVE